MTYSKGDASRRGAISCDFRPNSHIFANYNFALSSEWLNRWTERPPRATCYGATVQRAKRAACYVRRARATCTSRIASAARARAPGTCARAPGTSHVARGTSTSHAARVLHRSTTLARGTLHVIHVADPRRRRRSRYRRPDSALPREERTCRAGAGIGRRGAAEGARRAAGSHRPRPDAAGPRWPDGLPGVAVGPAHRRDPDHHGHGAGRRGGPHCRPRARRRRLRHEAFQRQGAGRARQRAAAPRAAPRPGGPGGPLRLDHDRLGAARRDRRRPGSPPDREGVPPPSLSGAAPRPGAVAGSPPHRRVGLSIYRWHPHRRRAHPAPAREGSRARRTPSKRSSSSATSSSMPEPRRPPFQSILR